MSESCTDDLHFPTVARFGDACGCWQALYDLSWMSAPRPL
jgi:hypothetical protein